MESSYLSLPDPAEAPTRSALILEMSFWVLLFLLGSSTGRACGNHFLSLELHHCHIDYILRSPSLRPQV